MRWRTCLALLLFLLTGCWDYRELDQLALVMAVGVDKAETPGRILITAQIARPSGEAKGKSGGGDQLGSVYTASAEGDTIFAAVRNLAQFTSRRIMWAHNNAVIIGEELAREDITPVIDFFTRNQELRMRTWVVVARGEKAQTLVTAKTGMEEVPANSISALFRYAQLPGEAIPTDMNAVAAAFFGPDTEPVISAMALREAASPAPDKQGEKGAGHQVELSGTAIFLGKRLVGYVDSDAGRGLQWLRAEMRNAVLTIPCPKDDDRNMAVEIRKPTTQIRSVLRGGKPEFYVSVEAQGILSEQDCATPQMSTVELKDYAEAEYARKIKQNIEAALSTVQKGMQSDAFLFGRQVHTDHPQWWRTNQDRWAKIFPEVKTHVTVTVDIPKMGLYVRPMRPNTD